MCVCARWIKDEHGTYGDRSGPVNSHRYHRHINQWTATHAFLAYKIAETSIYSTRSIEYSNVITVSIIVCVCVSMTYWM